MKNVPLCELSECLLFLLCVARIGVQPAHVVQLMYCGTMGPRISTELALKEWYVWLLGSCDALLSGCSLYPPS